MLPTENAHVASQLRNQIYYSLDNELLTTALFHAGRLHGYDPRNGDSAHLIALCHYRLGQYRAAYDYSREKGYRGTHLGCAYIFAQSCLALQKFQEGTTALDRARGLWALRNHWGKQGMMLHGVVTYMYQLNTRKLLDAMFPMPRLSTS